MSDSNESSSPSPPDEDNDSNSPPSKLPDGTSPPDNGDSGDSQSSSGEGPPPPPPPPPSTKSSSKISPPLPKESSPSSPLPPKTSPSSNSFANASPPPPDDSSSSSHSLTPSSSSLPPSPKNFSSPPPKSDSPPPPPPPPSSTPPAKSNNSTTPTSSTPPSKSNNSTIPTSSTPPSKSNNLTTPSSSLSSPPPSNLPQSPPPSSSPPPASPPTSSPTPSISSVPSSDSTLPTPGGSKNIPPPAVSKTPPSPIIIPPGRRPIKVSPPPDDFLSPPAGSGSINVDNPPSLGPLSNSHPRSPKHSRNTGSSSGSNTSSLNVHTVTVIGVAVAGVFLIALVAVVFVVRRRKKRADHTYNNNYMPPGHFSVKSEGYYPNGQVRKQNYRNSTDGFMGGQPQRSSISSGFGSQRMHHGGGGGGGSGGSDSGVIGGPNPHFSYEELMEITNGFSRQNILGEGGFGCVFKGWLSNGKEVAVKQLKAGSGQGEREFRAEVDIISRVHHRYLVSLVGYCISENHRLLIYEFVSNKTLEYHLHSSEAAVLDWPKRLKIALGAAKGLAYLHEDCHPKIIHRDIKSANILLDNAYEAKVADFGLAKLSSDAHTHVSTRVIGTFGYMAPEYASSGKLTDRSDVFSFGVVLLELLTGRKPVDSSQPLGDESLVEWARPLLIRALQTGELSELIDPRLQKHYVESEMIRMIEAAAACVRHSAPKRPRMMQVVRALDTEDDYSDLSNGVKYGQSTIYDSGQYNQDIMRFRMMPLDSDESSDYDAYSGEYASREFSGPQKSWKNSPSREVDSQNFGSDQHTNLRI